MVTPLWMVATDLGASSKAACLEAARLAAATKEHLHLVHVHRTEAVKEEFSTGSVTVEQHATLKKELEMQAAELNKEFPDLKIAVSVVDAAPAKGILDEADRIGAAHVVVGTHGRKGLAHLVLGSVAEEIVRKAPVPVTVVRG